jgi:acetolactate synthase-1/3 small subunit
LEAGSCCIHAKAALAAAAFDESIACQARRLPAPGEGSEKRNLSFMKHIIAVLLEIEVVKVVDLTEGSYTERELMMVKVRAVGKEREEMKRMADIFRGRIIDVTEKSYTVELTGDQSKNDAFLQALDRTAILETVRTGSCGIGRGERILRV